MVAAEQFGSVNADTAESQARAIAEAQLQSYINAEASTRAAADESLNRKILGNSDAIIELNTAIVTINDPPNMRADHRRRRVLICCIQCRRSTEPSPD